MNSDSNDTKFFRLWRNIVIRNEIFRYLRIYSRNKKVSFKNLESLRQFGEREFISSLVYNSNYDRNGDILCKGDLPEYGVLKEVDLRYGNLKPSSGDLIPYGVEVLIFGANNGEIQLSELPQSVHTIKDITLKRPYVNNQIPNNITSITFNRVDPIEFFDLIIPNSIKTLDISSLAYCLSRLSDAPLSFIPTSVTDLSVHYDITCTSKTPIIPTSVTKLSIWLAGSFNFSKGLIHYGVKELSIVGPGRNGIILEKDSLPESITKLCIYFGEDGNDNNIIQPHAIPQSVTDLEIEFTVYPNAFANIFPNNLKRLVLSSCYDIRKLPIEISELPTSIEYLEIDYVEIALNKQNKDDLYLKI